MNNTTIVYDFDILRLESVVVAVKETALGTMIVVEKTVFHPVSHTWPDQPGDVGRIDCAGMSFKVTNSFVGALNAKGEFFVDTAIPVKRAEQGWVFVVCHLVQGADESLVGKKATLIVDSEFRHGLSLCHSAVHLAALALNKVTRKYWKKDVIVDTLGNPDFDRLAIQESKVGVKRAHDRYRVGKSMKKKGFSREEFFQGLVRIQEEMNATLQEWIVTKGTIQTQGETGTLRDTRYWRCSLPDGEVKFPCGGTHAKSFDQYKEILVSLTRSSEEETEILMETTYSLSS